MSTVIASHQSVVGDGERPDKGCDQILFGGRVGVKSLFIGVELRFGRRDGKERIDKQRIARSADATADIDFSSVNRRLLNAGRIVEYYDVPLLYGAFAPAMIGNADISGRRRP